MPARKQRERFLLEQFLKIMNLVAEVEERETPDFILTSQDGLIGVEITELFISHERGHKTLQAQEFLSSRIVSMAQRMYESSGSPPAHVSVCFSPGQNLTRLNRDQTATMLCEFVGRMNLSVGSSRNWRPEHSNESLPSEISFIHALGVPTFEMAHWVVARAGWVAPLRASSLQERINDKAKRLSAYQNSVAQSWLLVVADAMKPSQLIESNEDFNPCSVSSPFTRTFFYRYPDTVAIELGAAKGW